MCQKHDILHTENLAILSFAQNSQINSWKLKLKRSMIKHFEKMAIEYFEIVYQKTKVNADTWQA